MNLKKLIDNSWNNRSLLKEKTTINSIENVISSLDKGEIREKGTFDELKKRSNLFIKLSSAQNL